jgi:hypothetical protein
MQNPTTIELGDNDSIVITKNGKVVGFVEVQRVRNGDTELLANPVTCSGDWMKPAQEVIFNSFATTLATNVKSVDDLASAENFINFMNKVSA